ncbi:hypothetical protein DAPPUDRAFT_106622 [Daphnia pulex]|uniref:Uncharacterized protein n=1 Tax=Daphnia pulex TaxID=6669 RepID=E9GUA6_DAPPU|nr:hypothetical protein DAPPUDRAFT_106622 [Daphnia pulex]|eukprot:EFX77002.1 hypothetical protein DAPPUDRAFT_106622 [Daphnia pulex]
MCLLHLLLSLSFLCAEVSPAHIFAEVFLFNQSLSSDSQTLGGKEKLRDCPYAAGYAEQQLGRYTYGRGKKNEKTLAPLAQSPCEKLILDIIAASLSQRRSSPVTSRIAAAAGLSHFHAFQSSAAVAVGSRIRSIEDGQVYQVDVCINSKSGAPPPVSWKNNEYYILPSKE